MGHQTYSYPLKLKNAPVTMKLTGHTPLFRLLSLFVATLLRRPTKCWADSVTLTALNREAAGRPGSQSCEPRSETLSLLPGNSAPPRWR